MIGPEKITVLGVELTRYDHGFGAGYMAPWDAWLKPRVMLMGSHIHAHVSVVKDFSVSDPNLATACQMLEERVAQELSGLTALLQWAADNAERMRAREMARYAKQAADLEALKGKDDQAP